MPKDYTSGSMGRTTKVQYDCAEPKRAAVPKRLSQADKYCTPSFMGKEHSSKRDSSIRNGQVPLLVVRRYHSLFKIWTYLLRHLSLVYLEPPILDDNL